jgi:hypothetical protein
LLSTTPFRRGYLGCHSAHLPRNPYPSQSAHKFRPWHKPGTLWCLGARVVKSSQVTNHQ